ncbi:MAG TPA: NB-ARC domain-containing protein, partial [Ktedonobacteraceae bacterium]
MSRSFYRERDYAFGQAMLTLRINIGVTQTGLAERLGITRKAINRWEAGDSYPKVSHLKALLAFALEQRAFPAGREEEEIRAFWHAARQKVLLDERWLQEMLGQQPRLTLLISQHVEETSNTRQIVAQSLRQPQVDWSDAPVVLSFYGRAEEASMLTQWVIEEHCRVVSVLGMGGIGKSALAVHVMHQIAEHFEVVIWRSLRDAPPCETLLDECLQLLAPRVLQNMSVSLEKRLGFLLECLRNRRVLLVLDNLETLLEEGQSTGYMRPSYEGYTQLLRRIAETEHQSCLLLTSREKPADLVPLEGSRTWVRTLHLARLDNDACEHLLVEKDIVGNGAERTRLSEVYAGNPLALKIVAQTIVELFAGSITPFLEQGEVVFGGVRELLREQYVRLSDLEQIVLCWLAIVREPVTMGEVRTLLMAPRRSGELLEALDGLMRRSLIERGQRAGTFSLQSVVLEYVTLRLVAEASRELEQGQLSRLLQHGLSQAGAKDYVRQTQQRLLLRPLLVYMQSAPEGHAPVEA